MSLQSSATSYAVATLIPSDLDTLYASHVVDSSSAASSGYMFVSTFRAKSGSELLLRYELERLITHTRRDRACLFCDLFRLSADGSVFVIHSVWSNPENWLRRSGWQGHPAGLGLIDQCLLAPIEVVELQEIP